MNILRPHEIKKLRKEREQITKRLNELDLEIRQEKLADDTVLFEKMEWLKRAYENQDWSAIENLSLQIYQNITSDRLIEIDKDPGELMKQYASQPPGHKFPTRFRLDDIEIQRGIPIVVGAQPGVGKTTFGCNIAYDCIVKEQACVIFSVEMKPSQIWIKIFMIHLHIYKNEKRSFRIVQEWARNSSVEMAEFRRFMDVAKKYLLVIESEGFTATKIVSLWDRCEDHFGRSIQWAIVDYLQVMSAEKDLRTRTVREQMMYRSKVFKDKAKMTDTNILELSQLNKDNDFRESAAINDDAGMSIILESKKSKAEYEDKIKIKMIKSRFTELTDSEVVFEKKTGVIGDAQKGG